MTMGLIAAALGGLISLTAVRHAAGAVDPTQKCRAAKLNAITKQASAQLKCYSTALKAGTAVDPACLQAAGAKLIDTFRKAEGKGGCENIGNAVGISTRVEALGVTLAAELPPGPPVCQCGAGVPTDLEFTTTLPGGTCGSVADNSEGVSLDCGALYVGGGSNTFPLPITIPDMALLSTQVTACDHTSLAVSAPSGGFFGPPIAVPFTVSPGLSSCVVNTLADVVAGVANCTVGSALIDVPVAANVFLTGDGLPNRCGPAASNQGAPCTNDGNCTGDTCNPDPDIQPCPICNPTTLKCNGGPNNGLACTPGDSASLGPAYPTSLDCPPDGGQMIATVSVRFDLDTGMPSLTAAALGTQSRVFCGFCRDETSTGSLCFEGSPPVGCPASAVTGVAHPCASDADCAPPFESCEQRSDGAFADPQATSISETGSAAGDLTDGAPHASTLASTFCIPPVFNPVDTVDDFPGPAAVALPGTMQLLLSGD